MPAVSICIPAFRQVELLERTLDSVVVQRFTDYQLIITDDSPDSQVEDLVRSYDFGGRLRYFRNSRTLGAPGNWDEAMRQARAPLIKILHHDDCFAHADALGQFVALMSDNPDCPLGFSASRIEDARTRQCAVQCADAAQIAALRRHPERLLLHNVIGVPSVTIHRRAPGLDFDPRMTWYADVDFYMRALRQRPRVAFIAEPLVVTMTGASHQLRERLREDGVARMREALLLFEKAFAQLHTDPDVAAFWARLLGELRIRNLKAMDRHLDRHAQLPPSLRAYFQHLFSQPSRQAGEGLARFVPALLRAALLPRRPAN